MSYDPHDPRADALLWQRLSRPGVDHDALVVEHIASVHADDEAFMVQVSALDDAIDYVGALPSPGTDPSMAPQALAARRDELSAERERAMTTGRDELVAGIVEISHRGVNLDAATWHDVVTLDGDGFITEAIGDPVAYESARAQGSGAPAARIAARTPDPARVRTSGYAPVEAPTTLRTEPVRGLEHVSSPIARFKAQMAAHAAADALAAPQHDDQFSQ